jgi:hypothetical protein
MILVASRHHAQPHMRTVHEKTWKIVRDALADYSFSGLTATVGFVEGVLLLAEFLPREQSGQPMSTQLLGGAGGDATQEGMENRRSWALTGLAIRAAYGIGREWRYRVRADSSRSDRTRSWRRTYSGSGACEKCLDVVLSV